MYSSWFACYCLLFGAVVPVMFFPSLNPCGYNAIIVHQLELVVHPNRPLCHTCNMHLQLVYICEPAALFFSVGTQNSKTIFSAHSCWIYFSFYVGLLYTVFIHHQIHWCSCKKYLDPQQLDKVQTTVSEFVKSFSVNLNLIPKVLKFHIIAPRFGH